MEKALNKNRVGIIFGTTFAFWHLIWALCVLFGWAGAMTGGVFRLYFLSQNNLIMEFSLGIALLLILTAFAVGYFVGGSFAWIWNFIYREKSQDETREHVSPRISRA